MWFRKLRIAFSIALGIASVLLIAMWVSSYGTDHHTFHLGGIGWRSEQGRLSSFSPIGLFDDGTHSESIYVETTFLPREPPVELEWTVSVLGLHFFGPGSVWILDVPYWLVVLPTGVLAAVPWMRWSYRFSLRTMLIGTTLVAAVLGLVVYMSRQ